MTESTLHNVSGTLFYRERLALPPEAEVSVEIAFTPTDGDKAVVIGYDGFLTDGKQVPLAFNVPYDDSEIDGRRNYFIQASIKDSSRKLCFATHEPVNVITHDNPTSDVNVMLVRCPAAEQTAAVTGSAAYRERIMLPPDSVLTVRLLDVSRQDVPARVLGEQIYTTEGKQVPLPFAVAYDPAEIDARFSYSISARIEDGDGILRWITDSNNPVITRDNPSVGIEVWMRKV